MNKRTEKAAKACKVFTDTWPFENKCKQFFEEQDIIQYMFLCFPILPTPIEILTQMLIDRFKKNELVLADFWKALEFCSTLEEKSESEIVREIALRSNKSNHKRSPSGNNESPSKQKDQPVFDSEYCLEVLCNSVFIKKKALDNFRSFLQVVFSDKKSMIYGYYQAASYNLLRNFIKFSKSDRVIIQTCYVIEEIKHHMKNAEAINLDMEELLLSKKNLIPMSEKRDSQMRKSSMRPSLGTGDKPVEVQDIKQTETVSVTSENSIDSSDSEDKEEKAKEAFLTTLEEWLCTREQLLIGKSEYISEAIKNPDYFEIFLSLIFDPQSFPVSEQRAVKWREAFSEVSKTTKSYDSLVFDEQTRTATTSRRRMPRIIESLKNSFINLRSYKAMEVLLDIRNYKYMLGINHAALDNFYNLAYVTLHRDEVVCNMNHIFKLIELFVITEQDLSINLILHYNFLFRFLQALDFPLSSQFYLLILGLAEDFPITLQNLSKVYKYCQQTEFFLDIAMAVLHGESRIDTKKFDLRFKPNRVSDMIILSTEPNPDQDYHALKVIEAKKKKRLPEEEHTVPGDIDRILEKLKRHHIRSMTDISGKMWSRPKIATSLTKLNFGGPSLSIEKMKKYPSLYDKALELERQASLSRTDLENSPRTNRSYRRHNSTKKLSMKLIQGSQTPNQNSFRISVESKKGSDPGKDRGSLTKLPSEPKEVVVIKTNPPPFKLNLVSTTHTTPRGNTGFHKRALTSQGPRVTETGSTLLSPYAVDESLNPKALAELSGLYPSNIVEMMESDIEKEAKTQEFSVTAILQNDEYCLKLCELLHMMIRKIIEKARSAKFGLPSAPINDIKSFWWAFLEPQKCLFFELLLKNYLFKIKIHHLSESNSGYEAGLIVNMILGNLDLWGLDFFKKRIVEIAKGYMQFLCKTIVYSHVWNKRPDLNIYMQTYKVASPLGCARLMLVETLCLILKSDTENYYKILNEVSLTCWNVLVLWLFEYKTNNLYLNHIVKIFEILFLYGDEKMITSVLFKLNVLPKINDVLAQVYKNRVIIKAPLAEEVLLCLKQIVHLLNEAIQDRRDLQALKIQIALNVSWKELKKAIVNDKSMSSPRQQSRADSPGLSPMLPKNSKKGVKDLQTSNFNKKNSFDVPVAATQKIVPELQLPKIQSPHGFKKFSDPLIKPISGSVTERISKQMFKKA